MIEESRHLLRLFRENKEVLTSFVICRAGYDEVHVFENILSTDELKELNGKKNNKRRLEYCLGRYTGKRSISQLAGYNQLKNIIINKGVFNQPIVHMQNNPFNIQISISHVQNLAVAIAFPEKHPMGIDVEKISSKNIEALTSQMLESEIKLLAPFSIQPQVGLTLLWTAKEALSKVLKTGLTVPLNIFSIKKVVNSNGGYISEFTNFYQYKVFSWIINDNMFSICLPKNTKISIGVAPQCLFS